MFKITLVNTMYFSSVEKVVEKGLLKCDDCFILQCQSDKNAQRTEQNTWIVCGVFVHIVFYEYLDILSHSNLKLSQLDTFLVK